MLYKDKGVSVVDRPLEGSPAKAGILSASSLSLISTPHPARMPDGPAKKPGMGDFFFNPRGRLL